ncbi:MAG: hypothetical protein KDA68_19460, partial [Planctomycetaceae bacterium]|nr:hypothetical protein [Planctomycetaceae bacterium]
VYFDVDRTDKAGTLSRNWKRRITMLERSPSRPPQRSLIHVGFFTLFAAAIFAIPMLNIVPIRTLMARDDKPQSQPTPESKPEAVTEESSVEITPTEDPFSKPSGSDLIPKEVPSKKPKERIAKPGDIPYGDSTIQARPPGIAGVKVEEEEIVTYTPPAKPQPEFLPEPTDKEQDIFRILSLPLDFPFDVQQESLQGVVDLLKIQLKIQILIDKKDLEEEGISLDTPQFDLQVTDIKIESLLKLLFEPHDLAYSVEDGVLKIATRSALDAKKKVYIYPVGDLVSTRDDLGELLSTIESTLRTLQQNNEFQGGTFSINSSTRTLVATHSYNSHQEVLNLLRALRQAAALSPNSFLPASRIPTGSRGRNVEEDVDVRFAPRTIPATGGFGRGRRRDDDDAPTLTPEEEAQKAIEGSSR